MHRPFRSWTVTHSDGSKPLSKVSIRTLPFLWFRFTWLWYRLVWRTRGGREARIEMPKGNHVLVRREGHHVMIYEGVTKGLHRGGSHVKRLPLCDTSHRYFTQQPL